MSNADDRLPEDAEDRFAAEDGAVAHASDHVPSEVSDGDAGRLAVEAAADAAGSGSEDAPNRDEVVSVRGKHPARRLAIGAALSTVLLLALVLPGVSTIQSAYYDRYPEAREKIEFWEQSTHARMTCGSCHIEPGFAEHVKFGFTSIPAFYSQLIQGPTENNLFGAPSSDACLKCHSSNRRVSADGDLLIPHRAHIEKLGLECSSCHSNLVHVKNERGLNRPPMTGCMDRCHDGKKATRDCAGCHTGKQVPASHKRKDWGKVHSAESKKQDCGSCHKWSSDDFCENCHKNRPAGHAGNWKKGHAFKALNEGEDGCNVCHGEDGKYCKKCH